MTLPKPYKKQGTEDREMDKRRQVRKRYLVKKGFQLKFMCVIVVAMVLIALVTGLSVYSAVMQTLVTQFHGESLALIKHAITYKLFIRSLMLIFAIAVMSVFISHHVAGPLYKFEKTINALAQGAQVKEIRLRKRDAFYEMAEAINYLIKSLKV
jgi:signal peptidase II